MSVSLQVCCYRAGNLHLAAAAVAVLLLLLPRPHRCQSVSTSAAWNQIFVDLKQGA
jgi:hypothetical protein